MPDPSPRPLTIALVLASYTDNAPAGMERATAALAEGLRQLGHRALIVTAVPSPHPDVVTIGSVGVGFPCDDDELRDAITTHGQDDLVTTELRDLYQHHKVDIAVHVDALWGLGRAAPLDDQVRSVLAMHVVGHDQDLHPALARTDLVIAPSPTVLNQAQHRGYDTTDWQVVPNAVLLDHPPADDVQRERLRQHGPIRILARLGPEKNVPALLDAGRLVDRPIEIALAEAGFETEPGSQTAERNRCRYSAAHLTLGTIRNSLAWHEVPAWLASAAVVIVPSLRESFGLVALEAMSVATPVIAFDTDNLPTLIGTGDDAGGVIVPRTHGEHGLWQAADHLLTNPARYAEGSHAAYHRSRDYLPATIANTFLKAVS